MNTHTHSRHRWAHTAFFLLPLAIAINSAHARVSFSEIDIDPAGAYEMAEGIGGGVAAADFNNDGFIDIFLPTQEGRRDMLLLNEGTVDESGNPVFQNITTIAGIRGAPRSRIAIWFDYDGDELLDLLVLGDCYGCSEDQVLPTHADGFDGWPLSRRWSQPRLFRQDPERPLQGGKFNGFKRVTKEAGLADINFIDYFINSNLPFQQSADQDTFNPMHLGGISAGDVNGDGFLDLIVGHWHKAAANFDADQFFGGVILLNTEVNGKRTFVIREDLIGVDPQTGQTRPFLIGSMWQTVFHDFDGDNALDIFSAIDGSSNKLWRNTAHPEPGPYSTPLAAFQEIARQAGVHKSGPGFGVETEMGVSVADYDNDGDFDIYATLVNNSPEGPDPLFQNNSTPSGLAFENRSIAAGIGASVENQQSWGWGCTFFDADLDGWLDLAVTNGFDKEFAMPAGINDKPNWINDHSLLFMNDANGSTFTDVSHTAGFDDTGWGSSIIAADFDRDGDLDILQTRQRTYDFDNGDVSIGATPSVVRLHKNNVDPDSGWLVVKPRMTGPNHFAIGAVVRLAIDNPQDAQDLNMARLITAGTSFMGQEPPEAHFGLIHAQPGAQCTITIEWPDGRCDTVINADLNDILDQQITLAPSDIAAPYTDLDTADLIAYLTLWGASDPRADIAPPFGKLDVFDWIATLTNRFNGCPNPDPGT